MRQTLQLLRRGKPRPRAGAFPMKYRRVPEALKPMQGGQQYFEEFLLENAEERIRRAGASKHVANLEAPNYTVEARLPQADCSTSASEKPENPHRLSSAKALQQEMLLLAQQDPFVSTRGFNELEWYESSRAATAAGGETKGTEGGAKGVPDRVPDAEFFKQHFGYSLLKSATEMDVTQYSQLDLWGEMPKYNRDMIFLYLISRRRNTYAVAYDYEGKRLLKPYTAGNRGLKGGDRGFRGDGSTDNGHQVASMYLNDLLPKIREMRSNEGRPIERDEKIEVVVRVLGFYNGRAGAVRAVTDRSSEFSVRYFEDITPFPLNGPKMPRGVFK